MSLLMIHEAYMPVYRCPDFHCRRAGGHTDRSTLVSKKKKILEPVANSLTEKWCSNQTHMLQNIFFQTLTFFVSKYHSLFLNRQNKILANLLLRWCLQLPNVLILFNMYHVSQKANTTCLQRLFVSRASSVKWGNPFTFWPRDMMYANCIPSIFTT